MIWRTNTARTKFVVKPIEETSRRGVASPVGCEETGPTRRPSPGWSLLSTGLVAVPLVVMVIAAFGPALDNGFVNWDDDKNFVDNPYYRGLGASQWTWAWTTFWFGVYQPLAWLLFEAQYVRWELDPRGYHLTSLALHAVNAVVLYALAVALLRRCRPDWWRERPRACASCAGLATALFAVHPLRVEAVAWASGQPYLPCALFSMLSVLAYLRAFDTRRSPLRVWLVASFALFVAAMLFHAVAVGLPAVLLILDVYPLGRFVGGRGRWYGPSARVVWREKVPFVMVSVVFMGVAIAARRQSLVLVEQSTPWASLARACYGIWFYPIKTVVPLDLIAVYPAPGEADWRTWPFLVAIVGTLAMSMILYVLRGRWPGLLAAWLSYLVILAPNSGLIRINDQMAADRYSYLSMLGFVVVLAACLCGIWRTIERSRPASLVVIALGVSALAVLITMTRGQCRTWRDSESLWTHALSHGAENSLLAHYNLALLLYHRGRLQAAADHYAEALRLNPRDAVVYNNLGAVLQRQGKLAAAAARYAEAIRLDPNYLDAHYNMGIVLSHQGKFDAAAFHYDEALRIDPAFANAHNNLGVDLFRQGQFAEAEAHYNEALRLDRARVDTHTNLAVVLSRQGKRQAAAAHEAEALRLGRESLEARKHWGLGVAREKKDAGPAR